jgi:outer membrane protein OmpA-like peptidoglycan-associated protein
LTTFLKRNPELKVELAGHTDNVGNDSYNLKLSSDRAEIVKQALVDNGIDATRLTAKGYGATQPLVPNDSEEHRAMNRRTEMVVK